MGLFHDILFEAKTEQFEKDLKNAYGMGFRDGRLCPADLRPCTVQGSPAFFHRWVTDDRVLLKINTFCRPNEAERIYSKFVETSVIQDGCTTEKVTEVLALVEMPDGSVKKVPAIQIRFTDREG